MDDMRIPTVVEMGPLVKQVHDFVAEQDRKCGKSAIDTLIAVGVGVLRYNEKDNDFLSFVKDRVHELAKAVYDHRQASEFEGWTSSYHETYGDLKEVSSTLNSTMDHAIRVCMGNGSVALMTVLVAARVISLASGAYLLRDEFNEVVDSAYHHLEEDDGTRH